MSCVLHAAWALWSLGYPEQAAVRMQQAMARARMLDHPFSMAHAHRFASAFHACLRESDAALEHADAAIAIATEHGFAVPLMGATFCRGLALVAKGREEGLAMMQTGVAAVRQIRAGLLLPSSVGWLAEACATLGRRDEALALVDEALAAAAESGVDHWSAELHRVRGELTDAEASFVEALAIARRQGAKSFELRAAMSLARRLAKRGKRTEARALLAGIHGWFTEGFETPDLREATALLADLGGRRGYFSPR
jgi:predicted ATPase